MDAAESDRAVRPRLTVSSRGLSPTRGTLINGSEKLHQAGGLSSSLHADPSSEALLPVPCPVSPQRPAAVPAWWLPERGPGDLPSLVLRGGPRGQDTEAAGHLPFPADGLVLSAWVSICDSV